jgi:hypothetical protein
VAINPINGKPESLTVDDGGRGVAAAASYAVDAREPCPAGSGGVVLSRREVRAATATVLEGAAAADGGWEAAAPLALREPGLAIFDGGTYSRGPLHLLGEEEEEEEGEYDEEEEDADDGVSDDRAALERLLLQDGADAAAAGAGAGAASAAAAASDDDDDAPLPSTPDTGAYDGDDETVSVIETCLAWGGEARLRVALTLAASLDEAGELAVTPLRITAHRETWQCLSGGDVGACALPGGDARAPAALPDRADPRAAATAFGGAWKAFDVTAHGLGPPPSAEEEDVLDQDALAAVYSTSSSLQTWRLTPAAPPSADGGAYVLPDPGAGPAAGPAIVELAMVDPVSRGAAADADEGMEGAGGRGLVVSVVWAPREGAVVAAQRVYDGGGELVEGRCRAAVRCGAAAGEG